MLSDLQNLPKQGFDLFEGSAWHIPLLSIQFPPSTCLRMQQHPKPPSIIMTRPSPPRLEIPRASSATPSNNSATAHTGRPPMWTKSAQRKMTRLYLYTTLPLSKILEIIHRSTTHSTPGHDSANKKLNALLDKEPRWLHPRTKTDMGRRVDQLSQSVTRFRHRNNTTTTTAYTHSYSNSDPGPQGVPVYIKQDQYLSPASLGGTDAFYRSRTPTAALEGFYPSSSDNRSQASSFERVVPPMTHSHLEETDNATFMPFLRRTTIMSTSTDDSTGSLHRILRDYSEPYVKVVKRLVRRFTGPQQEVMSASPASDGPTAIQRWLDDDDAPPEYNIQAYPLPGDFLNVDLSLQTRCHPQSSDHIWRRCMCLPLREIGKSVWSTALGLSAPADRLLSGYLEPPDVLLRDEFDNTSLHLLAARGNIDLLFNAVRSPICDGLLAATNTAGQTFLHLVQRSVTRRVDLFCQLLSVLTAKGVDIYACDDYGRNIFHILKQAGESSSLVSSILEHCGPTIPGSRDAFGTSPVIAGEQNDDGGMMLRNILDYWVPSYPGAETHDNLPMRVRDVASPVASQSSPDIREPAQIALSRHVSSLPSNLDDPTIETQRSLLNTINWSMRHPNTEDEQGRNGLHCLAEASLSYLPSGDHNNRSPSGTSSGRKRKFAEYNNDSSSTVLAARLQLVQGLLNTKVNPSHYDRNGNTPLMAFAASLPEDGDYKLGPVIIEALISHGANVNARNRRGETALHVAARCGRKLAVRALVQHGANVNARDAGGRSVLDVLDAKMMSSRDDSPKTYAHYEACRAWLSGVSGGALQNPSIIDEWSRRE